MIDDSSFLFDYHSHTWRRCPKGYEYYHDSHVTPCSIINQIPSVPRNCNLNSDPDSGSWHNSFYHILIYMDIDISRENRIKWTNQDFNQQSQPRLTSDKPNLYNLDHLNCVHFINSDSGTDFLNWIKTCWARDGTTFMVPVWYLYSTFTVKFTALFRL